MRQILLYAEEIPAGKVHNGRVQFPEFDLAESQRHAQILMEEGYLEGFYNKDSQGFPNAFVIRDLTMLGHDFLSNARNNTVWQKVMAKAKSEGTSVSMSVLNGLLSAAAKKYAGME